MSAIGENTNIKVGMAIVVAGFLIGSVWWAATLQTKVDALLVGVSKYEVQAARIMELSTRLDLMDQTGTKHEREWVNKMTEIERRLFIVESTLKPK